MACIYCHVTQVLFSSLQLFSVEVSWHVQVFDFGQLNVWDILCTTSCNSCRL